MNHSKKYCMSFVLLFGAYNYCVGAEEPVNTKDITQCVPTTLPAQDVMPVPADSQSSPPQNTETAGSDKKPIDKININIHPIFDESIPEENNWLFRLINKLHINTRTSVIKNDLQVKEGDVADAKLLAESERLLRTRRYLNSASVASRIDCNNQKNVDVDVREVWTLVPEITYSHTGGNSNYGFGLHDSNFLGTGKTVNIAHSETSLRSSDLVEYIDPNTGFDNTALALQFSNNSDGQKTAISFTKPFVTLDTKWTAGITYQKLSEEDTLYQEGKEADRFAHDNNNQTFFYGVKINTDSRDSIHRVLIGYTNWDDSFDTVINGTPPKISSVVPDGRQYSYPWIEYQHIYDEYVEAQNIQQINRIEDINLGSQIRVRVGYTSSKYIANDRNMIFDAEFSQGFQITPNQLILAHITATGLDDGDQIYNSIVKTEVSYHWQNFNRAQFYVDVSDAKGTHLFKDLPLELGGDTGLRGYPIRYTSGEHLQLVTVEQRYFGQKEWFSLFHLGAAIFYDQGRVFGNTAIPQTQQGWLRDFGIGLRVSGTRNGNTDEGEHNVLHIDIASPLDGSKDLSKVQWLVKVKKSF